MASLSLATVPVHAIDLSPGSHVLIGDVTWEQYEALLDNLGDDRRSPRINYCRGALELMSPLPAHERPHRIIADIIKAILDAQDRPWEDFGSTTFKRPKQAGLEPDTCFYIHNAELVRGLLRIDLETDPPPDLAIEVDVTSKTTLEAYAAIGVPEVWIYENDQLTIYRLGAEAYQPSTSEIFPDLPITSLVPQLVQQALSQGTSAMLRRLRDTLNASENNP